MQVDLFMGFSIISVVLCGIIVFCYSYSDTAYRFKMRWGYGLDTAVKIVILTISIAEFFIGIWAAICCCLIKPCTWQVSLTSEMKHTVLTRHSCIH